MAKSLFFTASSSSPPPSSNFYTLSDIGSESDSIDGSEYEYEELYCIFTETMSLLMIEEYAKSLMSVFEKNMSDFHTENKMNDSEDSLINALLAKQLSSILLDEFKLTIKTALGESHHADNKEKQHKPVTREMEPILFISSERLRYYTLTSIGRNQNVVVNHNISHFLLLGSCYKTGWVLLAEGCDENTAISISYFNVFTQTTKILPKIPFSHRDFSDIYGCFTSVPQCEMNVTMVVTHLRNTKAFITHKNYPGCNNWSSYMVEVEGDLEVEVEFEEEDVNSQSPVAHNFFDTKFVWLDVSSDIIYVLSNWHLPTEPTHTSNYDLEALADASFVSSIVIDAQVYLIGEDIEGIMRVYRVNHEGEHLHLILEDNLDERCFFISADRSGFGVRRSSEKNWIYIAGYLGFDLLKVKYEYGFGIAQIPVITCHDLDDGNCGCRTSFFHAIDF